jgi:HK97 family phage major capsid protein
MVGAGTTNTLTGIFNASSSVIPTASDIEITAITNTTLDAIIYGYGGDEAVEGSCVLILNKKDLAAFARLRSEDGKKIHTIIPGPTGGFGTIDGTPYIINSGCPALSDSNTAANTYCMAYGNLKNYQLAVFSDIEVKRSEDYKFKEGMIAHKAVVFVGGNVVSYKGFVRVKKKSE